MSVGFAVADLANPIFADIVRGAERELRASGYSLLLTNSEGDPELDADNIELLEDRQVDGMLTCRSRRKTTPTSFVRCAPVRFRWCSSTATDPKGSRRCSPASIIGSA